MSLLAVPQRVGQLIVFGGSFDPPTRAHLELARAARDAAVPDAWLVLVPAARSPHKDTAPSASNEDRLAMLGLAVRAVPRAVVWTDELDRASAGQPSYMIQTIRRLGSLWPHPPALRLLIGADQAIAFDRWRDARALIQLAEPLVLLREPIDTEAALIDRLAATGAWSKAELDQWGRWIAPVGTIPASATQVRAALAGGGPDAELEPLLDPAVLSYIRAHQLYEPPEADGPAEAV